MKPTAPINPIPTAETFAVNSISFLVGFLNTDQTRLHLSKNDFVFSVNVILKEDRKGF